MKLGESTGGRPPYIVEEEDITLAQQLASHGYSKKAIAKALDIDEVTLYNIEDRDSSFFKCIKRGVVKHCLASEQKLLDGDITPTAYIYWSKTKWRNFYPQEEKQAVDFQNRPDVKVTFGYQDSSKEYHSYEELKQE